MFIHYLFNRPFPGLEKNTAQKVASCGEKCSDSVELLAELLGFLNCHIQLMDWGEKFSPLSFYNSVVNILKKTQQQISTPYIAMLGLVQLHKNLHVKYIAVAK